MHLAKPAPHVDSSASVAVGPSPRMKAVYEFLRAIESSDSTVLISGESGTGKEVIARRIHECSRRRHRPFVAVSCALFSETLIESELFGHERGAFTGAVGDRPGRFEIAEGGTLFLDDIDDVPVSMQVKLLRVLQNHTVERVGGVRSIPVNVRILAASKKELREMVSAGTFREDLYYRLNVVPIALPPLRARPEDIPALMDHFFARFFQQRGDDVPPIAEAVRRAFLAYSWPGNVRELENACERIAQTLVCGEIGTGCVAANILFGAADRLWPRVPEALPSARTIAPAPAAAPTTAADPWVAPAGPLVGPSNVVQAALSTGSTEPSALPRGSGPGGPASGVTERSLLEAFTAGGLSLDDKLLEVEARLIRAALDASGGNKTRAAELLKIGRSTLGDRIKRCQIERPALFPHAIAPHAVAPRASESARHAETPAAGDEQTVGGGNDDQAARVEREAEMPV